ncbi:MAG: holo-[acyl-carrier-protein] synthase [Actinobacteria bacterium]|nr:MAG: holo-[acyl-carrier-protein] synthase [Actinomycetota bacterium]
MVFGLGVDIVEIERMRVALEKHPRMKERCFSAAEREYCEKRARPEVHYALRFAAKEAVLKALGSGFSGMRFTDVEVGRDERGRPQPILHGNAAETAERLGVTEMHLSLSFTHVTAVASAVALTGGSAPKPPEVDPKDRLAAAFREARGMLDSIGAAADDDAVEPGAVIEGEPGEDA